MLRRLHVIAPLVLVAGCAAIAVPNFYTALQRSKVKRSMANLRSWGEGIEEYMVKHRSWPRPGYEGPVAGIAPLVSASVHHFSLRSTGRDGKNDGLAASWQNAPDGKRQARHSH